MMNVYVLSVIHRNGGPSSNQMAAFRQMADREKARKEVMVDLLANVGSDRGELEQLSMEDLRAKYRELGLHLHVEIWTATLPIR